MNTNECILHFGPLEFNKCEMTLFKEYLHNYIKFIYRIYIIYIYTFYKFIQYEICLIWLSHCIEIFNTVP